MGRWRLDEKEGRNWAAGKATIDQQGTTWTLKREGADKKNMTAYEYADPDTGRIWWHDTGVHQNATFCVQPDPISGMQCWHQRVRVTPAAAGDEYGDVVVDTAKSREAYLEWMEKTRPAGTTNDSGLRRPLWYARPLKPTISAYRLPPNLDGPDRPITALPGLKLDQQVRERLLLVGVSALALEPGRRRRSISRRASTHERNVARVALTV